MADQEMRRSPALSILNGAITGFVGAFLTSFVSSGFGLPLKLWQISAVLVPLGVVISLAIRAFMQKILSGPDTQLKQIIGDYQEHREMERERLKETFNLSSQNILRIVAILVIVVLVFLAIAVEETFGVRVPTAAIIGAGILFGALLLRRPKA